MLEILSLAEIALFYKDAFGRYGYVNDAGARMLGAKASRVIGSDDYELFAPRSADIIRLRDQHVNAVRGPVEYESKVSVLGRSGPTSFYSVKQAIRTPRGINTGVLGLSACIRSDEALVATRVLIDHLVRLRPESLLEVCRRSIPPRLV